MSSLVDPGGREGRFLGPDDRLRRQQGRISGDPGRGAYVRRVGGLLESVLPEAQGPRPSAHLPVHLGREPRHPGRGP